MEEPDELEEPAKLDEAGELKDAAQPAVEPFPDEPAERVRAIIERVLEVMGLDAEVEVTEQEEEIYAAIDGDDELGILIGRRGQTLDALQVLCYRAAARGQAERKRVTVDAAGYREQRREVLEDEADAAAARAERNGEPVRLEPMSASERRMVHEFLKDRPEVETYSEGDEPDRRLVIAPLVSD